MTSFQNSRTVKTTHCYNPLSGIQFNVTRVDQNKLKQINRCIHGDGDRKYIRPRRSASLNISLDTSKHLMRGIEPLETPSPLKEPSKFLGKNINPENSNPPVITYTITKHLHQKPRNRTSESLDMSSSISEHKDLNPKQNNYVDISLHPNESSTLSNIQKDFICQVIPSTSHDNTDKKDFECQTDSQSDSLSQHNSSISGVANEVQSTTSKNISCNVISTIIIPSNIGEEGSKVISMPEESPEGSPEESPEISEEIEGVPSETETKSSDNLQIANTSSKNEDVHININNNTKFFITKNYTCSCHNAGNISTHWAAGGLGKWPP